MATVHRVARRHGGRKAPPGDTLQRPFACPTLELPFLDRRSGQVQGDARLLDSGRSPLGRPSGKRGARRPRRVYDGPVDRVPNPDGTAATEPGRGKAPELARALSLPLLVLYGLGTIIGAGIYVLVGKVAGIAGLLAPFAFLLAGAVALVSAFTYAELAARYPRSAGEPLYVAQGFGMRGISLWVGLLIVAMGTISAAAVARGFVGYLQVFVDVPAPAASAVLLLTLGALAAWGIAESAWIAAASTLLEIAGLLLVIAVCGDSLATLPARVPELVPSLAVADWRAVFLGAFLAFFAFIGFEDMVNVAEEARHPVRDMPRAILLASIGSTVLYLLVALVAVLSVLPEELAGSDAPLAMLYQRATGREPTHIALIGIVAVVNGALVQMIMASRVLYGMSREGWLPTALGRVGARTRTPLVATVAVTFAALAGALLMPVVALAQWASFVVLVVFALVNAALLRLKLRRVAAPPGAVRVPAWVPALGCALSLLLLAAQAAALARG